MLPTSFEESFDGTIRIAILYVAPGRRRRRVAAEVRLLPALDLDDAAMLPVLDLDAAAHHANLGFAGCGPLNDEGG